MYKLEITAFALIYATGAMSLAGSLHDAVRSGDEKTVLALLAEGEDIDSRLEDGATPLHIATNVGNATIVKLLLERGSDVNAALIGPSSGGKQYPGFTPLHSAALVGKVPIGRILLDHGADPRAKSYLDVGEPNAPDYRLIWQTPIQLCIGTLPPWQREDTDFLELLLSTDKSLMNEVDSPLLVEAAQYGELESVKVLLEFGALIEEGGIFDQTPLLSAAGAGRIEVVEFLIARGADLNRPSSGGATPLVAAIEGGNPGIVRLLLESGADPNPHLTGSAEDLRFYISPLGRAQQKENPEIIDILLEYGAKKPPWIYYFWKLTILPANSTDALFHIGSALLTGVVVGWIVRRRRANAVKAKVS